MSEIPGDLKFLSSHEWARLEDDGTVTVGISDHAQDLLGDIVFIELPEVGKEVEAEGDAAIPIAAADQDEEREDGGEHEPPYQPRVVLWEQRG